MRKLLFVGVLVLIQAEGFSQYSEAEVLQKIEAYQIAEDPFYDEGLFPSQREWLFFSKPVEDNTIFFTASIVSTLRMLHGDLSEDDRRIAHKIIQNASSLYSKYESRNGEPTYNFWQTISPDLPFPNGNRFISNEKARLPDDFDTSVLAILAQEQNHRLDAQFREKMISYSKRSNRGDVRLLTPEVYQNSLAYEVWFGKNMPQTFDICVMSNVMLFVLDRDFELNKYDRATISLIQEMILNNDHKEHTSTISHHSSSQALVLYHVSRLIASDDQGLFESIIEQVTADLEDLIQHVDNELEKVLIYSSLRRLGQEREYHIDFSKLENDVKTFEFFSFDPDALGWGRFLPTFRWVSESYNWTLVLEYLTLSKH